VINSLPKSDPSPFKLELGSFRFIGIIAIVGFFAGLHIGRNGWASPDLGTGNIFYYLYYQYQLWMCLLSGVLVLALGSWYQKFSKKS